ncbi:hypothetical protein [Vibrio metschnikovii]|uniref:hypothetical protein n=1 Tax=Vibrio metschnikovii TaxID=28172 RepID=UPI001C2F433B|nr:hypothetical protein [Vibrio metschnikovii]
MFQSEKEMQSWLSKELEDVEAFPNLILTSDFEPTISHASRKVLDSYDYCLRTLNMTKVVCEDKDISQFPNEVLRPDFLLYSMETESWVIVELKNIAGPTRQTATELSAYSNALKTYFPGMSDGDVINVVISNEWPTLLKNYVFNEIYWLNRRIICLKPIRIGASIKLECLSPNDLTKNFAQKLLTKDSFSGYQLCLYGNTIYSGGKVSDLENHIEQIRSSFYRIVNRSSVLHSHGFAFLWRDFRKHSVSAYSITIVDINPFEKKLYETCQEKGIANELQEVLYDNEATGNTYSLFEIMNESDFYLRSICSSWPEGSSSWSNLKEYMIESAELIEFRCWGVVSEIYESELSEEYNKGNISTKYECPIFGLEFVERKLFET